MRRLRLRWRLAVSHAALAILLVAFAGNRIQAESRLTTKATAVATAERDADVLATRASRVFDKDAIMADLLADQQGPSVQAEVAAADGRVIAGIDLARTGTPATVSRKVIASGVPATGFSANNAVVAAAPITIDSQMVGVAIVSETVPGHVPTLVSFGGSSWLGILIIAFAAVAGWLLASLLSRPIANLTDDVRHLALGAPVATKGRHALPEVETLEAAIRGIAARGKRRHDTDAEQRAASRTMARRLSHQLRTPLTVLRLRLDALGDASLDPARRDILVGIVADQIDRLDLLGEELATLDPSTSELHLETVDLAVLVRDIVVRNAPLAKWGGIQMQFHEDTDPDHTLRADAGLLDDAVTNLVQNAIKYTPRGGRIDVRLERRATETTVKVSDTGPGIKPMERDHVLRSGVRGSARGDAPGSGHGLSLAADAVQRHGGRIEIDETPEGGTTIRLVLPTSTATRSDQRREDGPDNVPLTDLR